ncbi:MAG: allantoicase [Proteobacteria bacterium]|nr:allantoicase [Pseudomonadota bacterium]
MTERLISAFAGLLDLASADLGGEVMACSDDFFASMDHLLRPHEAVFDPDAYTDRGKLMDGWESRRRRMPGHDWCIVKLGVPGLVRGVDIDCHHFLGNHPPFASIDAVHAPGASIDELRQASWEEVLRQTPLKAGSRNLAALDVPRDCTHLRLNMIPAGGIARLRVYGEPHRTLPAWSENIDLAAMIHGGKALACSDMFFSPMSNLIRPGRASDMGGGWETRRSRPPGEDWIILQLGAAGTLDRFVVDTHHFKGNYPDACAVDGILWPDAPPWSLVTSTDWTEIRPWSALHADAMVELECTDPGPWTHVRLRIRPDGGVSRLRVLGQPAPEAESDPDLSVINDARPRDARHLFERCCGATRWVEAMVAGRPYVSRAHLQGAAEAVWWTLDDADWLEAFTHHPRIGSDMESLRARFRGTADLSASEQAGVGQASELTLKALAKGNVDYEDRYGFLFIVCATGKSAPEMLALLRDRLDHDVGVERRLAAAEQAKITRIRLNGLLP